jgi:sucrose-phosphate synthase
MQMEVLMTSESINPFDPTPHSGFAPEIDAESKSESMTIAAETAKERSDDSNHREDGLYIAMLSIHGLVRSFDLELGRDADTGGQVTYVVELLKALSEHPDIRKVDLFTRRIVDPKVDDSYALNCEEVTDKGSIIRVDFGPRRYLRKEVLWPHLDDGVNSILAYFRDIRQIPDIVHGHYADAGYMAAHLSALLGIPMVFTGHSLGKVKNERLLKKGMKQERIEEVFRISRRINAEEYALKNAGLVVASTYQETDEQYAEYKNYKKTRARVIPPGVDLTRFHTSVTPRPAILSDIRKFWKEPGKPIILALSRPDSRKNIPGLIKTFANNETLKKNANLLIIAGNREDIRKMASESRKVLEEILFLIDSYDLYGRVAIPKHHCSEDVPKIYRMTARSHGVFVNPALTEPFGLTLIEAAACGVPIVTTNDGGPRDIIRYCKNGILVDPLDTEEMGYAIKTILSDRQTWSKYSRSGSRNVQKQYSWERHVETCLRQIRRRLISRKKTVQKPVRRSVLPTLDRLIICDLDNTLLGDQAALESFFALIHEQRFKVGFGIATGRRFKSAMKELKRWDIPIPDLLITGVGTEIFYGTTLTRDRGWTSRIHYRWEPDNIQNVVKNLPGINIQPGTEQSPYKLSYYIDPAKAPGIRQIRRILADHNLLARVVFSLGMYLDFIPVRASKGAAIRFLAKKWHLPMSHILVAGDSGNDRDMLQTAPQAVVVGNHSKEIKSLKNQTGIYFAKASHAAGVVEGIKHFDLLAHPFYNPNDSQGE